jgi:GLPGLI family protein
MNLLKYFLLLFLFNFSSAQEGSVQYRNDAELDLYFQEIKDSDSTEWERVKEFGNLKLKIDKSIRHKLFFKNEKALFKPILNENDEYLLKLSKDKSGHFYKDNAENYFFVNKRFKNFNVQLVPIEWEITSDSKQILGYECLKAYGNKNNEGTHKFFSRIEAWFTNEIELSHGPYGINGLPGLILEAHKGSYHFYAEVLKIELQESISKPTKGEIITEFNFNKLMQSSVKQ